MSHTLRRILCALLCSFLCTTFNLTEVTKITLKTQALIRWRCSLVHWLRRREKEKKTGRTLLCQKVQSLGTHGQIVYTLTLGINRLWHMSKAFFGRFKIKPHWYQPSRFVGEWFTTRLTCQGALGKKRVAAPLLTLIFLPLYFLLQHQFFSTGIDLFSHFDLSQQEMDFL